MRFVLTYLLALFSTLSLAETIPTLHAKSFVDAPVELPAELHGREGVLVLGFSKKSSLQTRQWNDQLLKDYTSTPPFLYYQAAVLADVPAIIRGVVISGIRNQMSPADRAHFITILEDEAKWKQAAHFASPDEAYVLVIDGTGQVRWRTHGPPTKETYSQMKEILATPQAHQ